MSKKIIEAIRQMLIKIVIPFRAKKETFLHNFRLSIAFRISLNYLKLMLTHGILFVAIFALIYMYSEKSNFHSMGKELIESMEMESDTPCINLYAAQGLSMRLVETRVGKELYNDIAYVAASEKEFYHGIHYDRKSKDNILIISECITYTVKDNKYNETEYKAYFQYDLTQSYIDMISLLWKLIILYLFIVFLIIRKGKKGDIKLFEPVRIMSATANRLTVNNLQSERLNVEGTKNELKDLAAVVNAMLDRIETSYESQKQFVSDASHELRTPIAVIQGYANLLNRWGTKDEEVLQESIEAIQNESKAMQDLVEKLLFLSRHDKKTFKLNKKRFNMRLVIEDMVKETKLVAVNRIITCPILEDVVVYGDKQSLKQALRIFIDNAVKYTEDGDEIKILCQKINEDCVITIQDTGIGMTQKDVDNIFSRFYRSDHVRNRNISGHGLGLSLAKLIILGHTGKIKVRSQYHKGSSFIITLPKRRV